MRNFKKIMSIFFLTFSISAFSQDKNVNIIASGDGKTKDEATNAALRHCIEKTLGVFVSTNSTVINDNLVTDEISTVASGNIISYEEISSSKNNDVFTVFVSAIVSPENLVFSYKKIGKNFELNTNVYYQNILKEEYYKKQEIQVINDFIEKFKSIKLIDSFDIKIKDAFHNNINWYDVHREGFSNFDKLINEMTGEFSTQNFDISHVPSALWLDNAKYDFDYTWNKARDCLNFKYNYDASVNIYSSKMSNQEGYGWDLVDHDSWKGYFKKEYPSGFYSIPIFYNPRLNEQTLLEFSNNLLNLLQKLNIININEYESKYGEAFRLTTYYLKKESKLPKSNGFIVPDEVKTFLRNKNSIDTLQQFCDFLLAQRFSCNDIIIKNIEFTPAIPSLIYSNSVLSIHNAKTQRSFKKFDIANHGASANKYFRPVRGVQPKLNNDDQPKLNNDDERFIDLVITNGKHLQLQYPHGFITGNYLTGYYPSLLLLNLTKEELGKLKNLEFEFK